MGIGAFTVSLNVKNIQQSKTFYEKLGFQEVGGNIEENWVILRNDDTTIGLFQGMFEENLLTFNPGWDKNGKNVDSFTDVRELQELWRSKGIEFIKEADITTKGPEYITLVDPDGNTILVDQHR